MKVAVHTFGCKVNLYESEYIINLLKNKNYSIVDFKKEADIYIINTCSVTNEADKKDRQLITRTRKKHQNAILVVMGCYSQLNPDKIDADIVIGNKYKSDIVSLIEEYLKNKEKIVKVEDISKTNFENMYIDKFNIHTRAFVKIQDGCNAFCAYCAIPYARGGIRSKELNTVIDEVTNLVNNGYKEIVLTGIHTGRYGIDNGHSLEELLKSLVNIPNIYRIRLSSIEINEITDGIIDLIKNNKVMAKHLHIPLQSGSNSILKSMGRLYDKEYFINRIKYIRREIPNISITTDLIVGFPGETEELFNETIDTLDKIRFTKIHTFPYSKRDGTRASIMSNQVDGVIKKRRVNQILRLSNIYENEYYKRNIGMVFDGVLEKRNDNECYVLTSNYISVLLNDNYNNNEILSVKIDRVIDDNVYGIVER